MEKAHSCSIDKPEAGAEGREQQRKKILGAGPGSSPPSSALKHMVISTARKSPRVPDAGSWPPSPSPLAQSLCPPVPSRPTSYGHTGSSWPRQVSSPQSASLLSSLRAFPLVFQALQSNLRYPLLPRRLIISKRLAQCLHPALPSGVHLKALETYEIIFKIVRTKWLAKDLFLYSCGLFPLLAHAAMSVKPVLLGLYEKYFLPLQKLLLPSLQAFIIGLLPGLEEGSEIYDRWVSSRAGGCAHPRGPPMRFVFYFTAV
ncbi:protein dopey-2-like [Physeter macrocephalus]|uniref:Protein dopey-2-like n=1 Tax=Physeter macrocephalus TaxID=9755 RepID=A0A455BJC9_PHYMC|nr:protein dopey-2-like [Physeter catodon]XP_028348934.1 protein dopey-2-like [Physeter catodon]|eukprot:XP_028348933.1 protein dopey-2-like [Physeter catodon]